MRWTKTEPEAIVLKGVEIEAIYESKTLKGVILKQGDTVVRFAYESYSSLTCFTPEIETTHVVTGHVAGVPLRVAFPDDKKYDAEEKQRDLEKAGAKDVKLVTFNGKSPVAVDDEIPF